MSAIGGVWEREDVCLVSTNGIQPGFYTIGIPLTGQPVGKAFNTQKEGAEQKANQTNTKRLIDTVCEATLWTYRGQE